MITIFAGAGASKALGYPITSEFYSHGRGASLQRRHPYVQVNKFLGKEVVDVEDALRLLYPFVDMLASPTGKMLKEDLERHWFKDIQPFVDETHDLCFDHYCRPPVEEKVRAAYLPLLEYCEWGNDPVAFFTTNYDPVTDSLMEIAEKEGIDSHDGFNRLGRWDSGGYADVEPKGIAIYRLHGSMSWIEERGKIVNTRDYRRRVGGAAQHLLIYPGFKGNPEEDGNRVYQFSHQALRNALAKSKRAIVVGFSFRDPHLNEIFADALETNEAIDIIVWTPHWPQGSNVGLGELVERFPGRIKHAAAAFGAPDLDVESLLEGASEPPSA